MYEISMRLNAGELCRSHLCTPMHSMAANSCLTSAVHTQPSTQNSTNSVFNLFWLVCQGRNNAHKVMAMMACITQILAAFSHVVTSRDFDLPAGAAALNSDNLGIARLESVWQ